MVKAAAEGSLPKKLIISRKEKVEQNWVVLTKVHTVRRALLLLINRRRQLAKQNTVFEFVPDQASAPSPWRMDGWIAVVSFFCVMGTFLTDEEQKTLFHS